MFPIPLTPTPNPGMVYVFISQNVLCSIDSPTQFNEPSKGQNLSVMVKARLELTTQSLLDPSNSSSCGSLLVASFLRDHWFHSSPALGETGFLAQPPGEALVSLSFIRFSAFCPGIKVGLPFHQKGSEQTKTAEDHFSFPVTALDWHTVTSLGKSSLQIPLSFGPQSLG